MRDCTACGVSKSEDEFYFKGRKALGIRMKECKACFNTRMMRRYEERAEYIVSLKGGKCLLCGYNKCLAALHFHHVDPTQKEFQISKRWSASKENILKEVEKCVLLCANCHAEEHYRIDRGQGTDFGSLA